MTLEGWAVVGVIGICLTLLLTTTIAVDLILLAGLAFLLISGILSPEEALSGFSNEGMLTVAALYVVAGGLKETGAIQMITQKIMGQTRNVRGAQARIMAPVMVMSAFMNNTPIVASFIPALEHWSKKTGIPVSKVLIPLSYAAILGGTCTLIGTSTNLILNGLLIEEGSIRSLGLFEPALIGIPCAIAGFIYLLLFGDKLLPSRGEAFQTFKDTREYTIEMLVPVGSPLARKTIQEAGLRQLPGLFLVEIVREDAVLPAVGPNQRLRENDRLIFAGVVESIVDLQSMNGLEPATDQVFKLDTPRKNRVLLEAVVSATHPLIDVTIKDGGFRNRYGAVILAISRSGKRIRKKVGDISLKAGDTLLIEADTNFLKKFKNSNEYYLVSSLSGVHRTDFNKSGVALFVLLGMVLLAGFQILTMFESVLLASAFMVLFRAISYPEAIKNIDWRLLIAIASAIGIGTAVTSSGIIDHLMILSNSYLINSIPVILIIVFATTWFLTEMITNAAAVVLMFPMVQAISANFELNLIPLVMIMLIAASTSFASPIGYQTNLMVYGPGGYTYMDYVKIGIPLTILNATIAITLVPLLWSF
ncbi:MAG: SLC13 family permease [bacterium]|nr:SLC13 family permease [bacterium]